MPTDEREDVMEFTNSWLEQGRAEGLTEGLAQGLENGLEKGRRQTAALVLGQLRHRFGTIPQSLNARVEALPIDQLTRLGEDLLDFTAAADLERWLERG
jgi:flagellar biosynthesis/type III secretory pathway protein FliH